MRHVIDLSETIESATEVAEASHVVTYSSEMFLQVMGFPQWWRC